jgi:predicted nucleic acid-binding protein
MNIVLDANIMAAIILPLPYSHASEKRISTWKLEGKLLTAPVLWEYELITVLRRATVQGLLNQKQVKQIFQKVKTVNIESVWPTEALHQRALIWADRLGQSRAYDAQYLALAEQFGTDLWTGDRRLANAAARLGLSWVHWIGED